MTPFPDERPDLAKRLPLAVRKLVKSIAAYEPDRIYLIGSYARGDYHDLSDIDLVVIKSTEREFFERMFDVAQYLRTAGRAVDVLVYTPEEFEDMIERGNAFAETVLEEGVLVYETRQERQCSGQALEAAGRAGPGAA